MSRVIPDTDGGAVAVNSQDLWHHSLFHSHRVPAHQLRNEVSLIWWPEVAVWKTHSRDTRAFSERPPPLLNIHFAMRSWGESEVGRQRKRAHSQPSLRPSLTSQWWQGGRDTLHKHESAKWDTWLCKCYFGSIQGRVLILPSEKELNLEFENPHFPPSSSSSGVPFNTPADPWPPHKQPVLSQRWVIVSATDTAHATGCGDGRAFICFISHLPFHCMLTLIF